MCQCSARAGRSGSLQQGTALCHACKKRRRIGSEKTKAHSHPRQFDRLDEWLASSVLSSNLVWVLALPRAVSSQEMNIFLGCTLTQRFGGHDYILSILESLFMTPMIVDPFKFP